MMTKFFAAAALLCQLSYGKTLSATYDVSFGIFQKLGVANTTLQINDDQTYAIRVEAKTQGIAKILSNNRYEVYESKETVNNGRLIPTTYTILRTTNSKWAKKIYTFDHAAKTVWKETIKRLDGDEDRNRKANEFYATEDILSLFFNIDQYAKKRENVFFTAVGANKEDGRVDIVFPKKGQLDEMKKTLALQDGEFVKVILNDRIFSSEKGELLLNLDTEGLCEKAILEDVLLFGDVVGKRVR